MLNNEDEIVNNKTDEQYFYDEMNYIIEKNNKSIENIKNSNLEHDKIEYVCEIFQENIKNANENYEKKINELKTRSNEENKEDIKIVLRGLNWDQDNINTLNIWIKECNMQKFTYEYVLDKITYKSKTIKIILLILAAVQILINVSNLGLDKNSYENINLGINILTSILSTITFIMTHFVIIVQFEENIKAYSTYCKDIELFLGNIISIASMKIELRPDGNQYILTNSEIYSDIYQKSPHIEKKYWIDANKAYQSCIKSINNGEDNYYARKKIIFNVYAVGNKTENIHAETDASTKEQQIDVLPVNNIYSLKNNMTIKKITTQGIPHSKEYDNVINMEMVKF